MIKINISFALIFFIIGFFCVFAFSCASTVPSAVSPESTAIAISIPEKKRNDFFISVSPDVIAKIENGSPESIRAGIGLMRKSMLEYKEDEKILLVVATNIMNIVWPTERVSWEIPEVSNSNPYIGAIESAKNGIYDTSTGNKDFLSILLPSLVLLTSSTRNDYYDLSYNALSLALSMRNDSVLANYLMGILLSKMQKFDESLQYLKKASSAIPTCFHTSYSLALGYKLAGDIAAARNAAELLVVQYPQNIDVLKLCSETAFAQRDYTSAEEYVVRVLQQEPENKQFVLFRVKVLLEKKEYMKAASLLDVYSRSDKKSREYLLLRSQLQHYWNRNNVAAVASIEEALNLYGEDDELLSFAIELASSTGSKINGFSAGDLAEKILSQNPDNQFALQVMAETLVNEQRWNEAYEMCKSFIEKPDASLESYFNFIDVCIELKKNDEAWNTVSALYQEKGDNEAVIQEYIKVLIAIGKKSEAANLIDSLIITSSSKMKSFLYYERSFIVQGDDEIFASLRSSLTSNPRNSDSLFRLYSIYLEKKDYRKAQYYLKQVVALNPSNERYLKLNSELELLINR